jgi:hypothetical protein
MELQAKKGKKKDVSDFSGKPSKPKDKSDFAGINKGPRDKSDFATNKKPTIKSKVTKSIVSKNTNKNKVKPKVVTPKMIKDAGFTTLRDYLNDKRGLTRKDGKKPVRVGDKKTVTNVIKKKSNGSKKVASLKTSRSGIDGGASQVNKAKKKIVKKNPMSTKTPKTFKGTNITPTKLQRDRMRKRAMGST